MEQLFAREYCIIIKLSRAHICAVEAVLGTGVFILAISGFSIKADGQKVIFLLTLIGLCIQVVLFLSVLSIFWWAVLLIRMFELILPDGRTIGPLHGGVLHIRGDLESFRLFVNKTASLTLHNRKLLFFLTLIVIQAKIDMIIILV